MIVFPNTKINIGLKVIEKRDDGFHNIETIFYPVPLCDILEFLPLGGGAKTSKFKNTGLQIDTPSDANNLCIKAYSIIKNDFDIPPLDIHLHKIIPFGAGLGGGSADAGFMLKALNDYFCLGISEEKLKFYASKLGSDCTFFIQNKTSFAWEKGEKLKEISLSLKGYHIVIVHPGFSVSTAEAYAGIIPEKSDCSLTDLVYKPIEKWREFIFNDFEKNIFEKYPAIKEIKDKLYTQGAIYASMSGSGSDRKSVV